METITHLKGGEAIVLAFAIAMAAAAFAAASGRLRWPTRPMARPGSVSPPA